MAYIYPTIQPRGALGPQNPADVIRMFQQQAQDARGPVGGGGPLSRMTPEERMTATFQTGSQYGNTQPPAMAPGQFGGQFMPQQPMGAMAPRGMPGGSVGMMRPRLMRRPRLGAAGTVPGQPLTLAPPPQHRTIDDLYQKPWWYRQQQQPQQFKPLAPY